MDSGTSVLDRAEAVGLSEVLYGRRSIRSYEPDRVDPLLIHLLLEAAVHAPTAMHQEPWEFVVVQDPALLRTVSDHSKQLAAESAAEHGTPLKPRGAPGEGRPSSLADPDFNIFYDARTLIVICGKPTSEFVAADCWLAAENLMLAAYAYGLGTCCIGFALPELNTPDGKALLGIPADRRVFVALIVGTPRGEARPVPRKPPVVLNWIR